ncbi:hypothetical protein [Streptomyces sp. Wb2n-11]|uniref:hypothetical protein n=1 Tax=Streptomyces sp. Wb2n-11 TaxID=1030533 RepID=UPI000AD9B823|nr:hypothetical protein [Streptomyces sp. Wb2n-11]
MSTILALAETGQSVLLAAPDPSQGDSTPPGWGKLLMVLHWVFIIVTALLVGGILVVAGKMALAYRHGDGAEHMGSLGKVMFACVLAASASGLVTTLTT